MGEAVIDGRTNICLQLRRGPFEAILHGNKRKEYRRGDDYYDSRFFKKRGLAFACDADTRRPIPKGWKTVTFLNGMGEDVPRMTWSIDRILIRHIGTGREIDLRDVSGMDDLSVEYEYCICLGELLASNRR